MPELFAEGNYLRHGGLVAARKLLTLPERPTAIMAANDQMAFAILEIAEELGIRVPDDLSLIGFDNLPDVAHSTPPLTTVAQSLVGMGNLAADLLMQMLEGRKVENRTSPFRRGSRGPEPGDRPPEGETWQQSRYVAGAVAYAVMRLLEKGVGQPSSAAPPPSGPNLMST